MPKRETHDLAHVLAAKAASDEAAVEGYADDPRIHDETFGFHAQQAVKKRRKSVLAANGVDSERTHNIAYLLGLLGDHALPAPPDAQELSELTPWATNFRYEDTAGRAIDRARMLQLVQAVRNWSGSSPGAES